MTRPSILDGFDSKRGGMEIQPCEISILADLILIYYCVNGRLPTRAEMLNLWAAYR